eukprot:6030234-Amphidinium_carterae.2
MSCDSQSIFRDEHLYGGLGLLLVCPNCGGSTEEHGCWGKLLSSKRKPSGFRSEGLCSLNIMAIRKYGKSRSPHLQVQEPGRIHTSSNLQLSTVGTKLFQSIYKQLTVIAQL